MAKLDQKERERIRNSQKPVAEQMHVSKEDKFPNLVQEYWKNPNSQKAHVVICPGAEPAEIDVHERPGI